MFRASIVARTRYIEDLVIGQTACGVDQYVLLGAGLDTFAQRLPEIASHLPVFEVDEPGLVETGYRIPESLKLVPVDFEAGESRRHKLVAGRDDVADPVDKASRHEAIMGNGPAKAPWFSMQIFAANAQNRRPAPTGAEWCP